MSKKELLLKIKKVEEIASASKLKRMLMNPFRYVDAIFFREFIYKKNKKEKEVRCNTFFDSYLHLLLPSSTDIYLTGGKSHHSEIRLAKFLIHHLNHDDTFLDVGAHYGYFSLLASKLVGKQGSIYSFEASPTTYGILQKNKLDIDNITAFNLAVSDTNSYLTFYEFPNLYSEYNTLDVEQFKNEDWFRDYKPKEIKIETIPLDHFLIEEKIKPRIIKIDVEGAEFKVINGMEKYLSNNAPIIVMEYLSSERENTGHIMADKLLKSLGFQSFSIDDEGKLCEVEVVSAYMKAKGLESDNIVFKKAA